MGLWSGRTFRVLTVLMVVNTVAFGVSVALGQPLPVALNWLPVPVIIALSAYLARGVTVAPDAPPAVARYWRITRAGLVVFCSTTVLRLLDALGVGLPLVAVATVAHVLGGVLMMGALYQLPLSPRTRSSKLTVTLDVGTLMVASGVLIFHFAVLPLFQASEVTVREVLTAILLMGAGVGTVQTAAKVAMSEVVTMSRRALAAAGASAVIGGLGSAIGLLLSLGLPAHPLILLLPPAAFAVALSARFQMVDATAAEVARPRRGYSLMPYTAVAVVSVMLVVTSATGSPDNLIVVGFAVVIIALVILRQLMAFRQNDTLLREIGRQERTFRALVQNSTDAVTIIDAAGVVTYASPAVRRTIGLDPDDLHSHRILDRAHPDDRDRALTELARMAEPGATATYEYRCLHADGGYRWLEVTSMNLLDDPAIRGIVSNTRDITETREVQARLSYDASHDALTGLANGTLFGRRVQAAVDRADPDARFSIVLIDLDDFKTVNDTLGHAFGDALLVHVGERMTAGVRPTDIVARLGGDEFAILFDGLTSDAIGGLLTRISHALLEPTVLDGELLSVRASFGVVEGRPGDDAGDLMRRADIAMYEAKEHGEGGHQLYRPGMEARGAERSRMAAELRTAIAEEQLVLHFQPEVTLPGGRIVGAEALVRWQHPKRGLLGPGAFVDTAEQTGLIVPLGRWVLRTATRQAAAWAATAGEPLPVSVNASPRQLRDPGFAGEVAAALRESGLPSRLLTLEITESAAVGGGATQETLHELRELGVRLSLDDFGTGASTLSLLATCPVDEIKLDRSFVPLPGTEAIATAVLQLARAFDVMAVAEGVETEEQARRLTELGYTRAQEYHFARPMPAEAFDALLTPSALR